MIMKTKKAVSELCDILGGIDYLLTTPKETIFSQITENQLNQYYSKLSDVCIERAKENNNGACGINDYTSFLSIKDRFKYSNKTVIDYCNSELFIHEIIYLLNNEIPV